MSSFGKRSKNFTENFLITFSEYFPIIALHNKESTTDSLRKSLKETSNGTSTNLYKDSTGNDFKIISEVLTKNTPGIFLRIIPGLFNKVHTVNLPEFLKKTIGLGLLKTTRMYSRNYSYNSSKNYYSSGINFWLRNPSNDFSRNYL